MELVDQDIKPRDIVTPQSIDNAFALDMAMGGSTNTVLHTFAIAHRGRGGLSARPAKRDVRAHPVHLQGLALQAGRAHGGRGSRRRHQRHHEGDQQQAGGAAPGRADGDRQYAGREYRRGGDHGCARHPFAGRSLHRGRRAGGALRQPGPGRRGDQERRGGPGVLRLRRRGDRLRLAGRMPGGAGAARGASPATWW